MAASRAYSSGWTATSLLPTLASMFSASSPVPQATPGPVVSARDSLIAKVMGKPVVNPAVKPGMASQTSQAADALAAQVLGKPTPTAAQPVPAKQPDQNPSVNSFSTVGFQYKPVTEL